MGPGTSREMILQHGGGAWVHGGIAADGFDPSAVCGLLHEAPPPVRNGAVIKATRAGLPELLGDDERVGSRKEVERKPVERQCDNEIRPDDNLSALQHSSTIETHRPRTRNHDNTMNSRTWNARRGPFATYGGLTSHMTVNEAIQQQLLVESEGKWAVCLDIKGASERPEQFDTMIPALKEQFGEGCEFGEVKPRVGDRGQGITFLVKLDKDAGWIRHEAANGRAGTRREHRPREDGHMGGH